MGAGASTLVWTVYADGSCIGNPGPGGWGVVLTEPGGTVSEFAGADPLTTNNRMEITAALEALRRIAPGAEVIINSDSQYLIKTMTLGWKRRENLDLWRLLDAEVAKRRVHWKWVRGHDGDPGNERADELARSAAEGRAPRPAVATGPPSAALANPASTYDTAAQKIAPLLELGEQVRRCPSCGEFFVSAADSRHCSRLPCQLASRTTNRLSK
jgi:ribonuclease HI